MNNPSNAHAVDNCTQRVLALKKHVSAKTTIMMTAAPPVVSTPAPATNGAAPVQNGAPHA